MRALTSLVNEGTKDSLKGRGIRLTRQRQILLDLIDKSGQHLDAESLYQLARKEDPKLNRVTVYRTLKLLKQGGLVDELDLMHVAGEQHYYETRMKQEHAHVAGEEIDLTRTEFDLLAHLVSHPGVVVAREELMRAVWASDFVPDSTHVVDVHLANLRRKLRRSASGNQWIRTIRGVGYVLSES